MRCLMPDSRLNGAERALQHSFRKFSYFQWLADGGGGRRWPICRCARCPIAGRCRRRPLRSAIGRLTLPPAQGRCGWPGAWEMEAPDPRFGGLSALAIEDGRFLAVSDRGRGRAVRPAVRGAAHRRWLAGPARRGLGPSGRKWARDAESLARDPRGRGWWVGYEQRHSLWLYDDGFGRALASIDLRTARLARQSRRGRVARRTGIAAGAGRKWPRCDLASARASCRSLTLGMPAPTSPMPRRRPTAAAGCCCGRKGLGGISQSIAPLRSGPMAAIGPARRWPVPKGAVRQL